MGLLTLRIIFPKWDLALRLWGERLGNFVPKRDPGSFNGAQRERWNAKCTPRVLLFIRQWNNQIHQHLLWVCVDPLYLGLFVEIGIVTKFIPNRLLTKPLMNGLRAGVATWSPDWKKSAWYPIWNYPIPNNPPRAWGCADVSWKY
jgi:hypothetical protein